jgi:hypothetical protein
MRYFVMALILVSLAACASKETGRWVRPSDKNDRYSQDSAVCRSEAKRRAEREFMLDTQSLGRRDVDTLGRQSIEMDLARRDAVRYQQQLYEECLRNMGYQQQSGPRPEYKLEAR